MKFSYCGLRCKFSNKEESVFECGTQKIIIEKDITDCIIPMNEYDFEFISDEKDGTYFVCEFECDKYNVVEFVLQNVLKGKENDKIHIYSHLDSYKNDDMKYFKYGTMFRVNTICK